MGVAQDMPPVDVDIARRAHGIRQTDDGLVGRAAREEVGLRADGIPNGGEGATDEVGAANARVAEAHGVEDAVREIHLEDLEAVGAQAAEDRLQVLDHLGHGRVEVGHWAVGVAIRLNLTIGALGEPLRLFQVERVVDVHQERGRPDPGDAPARLHVPAEVRQAFWELAIGLPASPLALPSLIDHERLQRVAKPLARRIQGLVHRLASDGTAVEVPAIPSDQGGAGRLAFQELVPSPPVLLHEIGAPRALQREEGRGANAFARIHPALEAEARLEAELGLQVRLGMQGDEFGEGRPHGGHDAEEQRLASFLLVDDEHVAGHDEIEPGRLAPHRFCPGIDPLEAGAVDELAEVPRLQGVREGRRRPPREVNRAQRPRLGTGIEHIQEEGARGALAQSELPIAMPT